MSYSSEVLADSPILYWRLDDASGTTAVDVSGSSRNGTYSGTYTLASTGLLAGDSNTAVVTSTGRVQIASDTWMDTDHVTAEIVVKPTTVSSSRWIIGRDHDGGTTELAWRIDMSSSKFRAICQLDGSSTIHVVTGTTTVVSGTTYHVAMTYDGSTLKLYVNGVSEGTPVSVSGVLKKTGRAINVARSGTNGLSYTGTLDEAAVYGTALSSARVLAHYTATQPVTAGTATLAGTLQAFTAAFTVGTVLAVSLAGTLQQETAAFAVDIPAAPDRTVSLAGELQRETASFEVLGAADVALVGELQRETAAFAVSASAQVTMAGNLPAMTALFALESGKTLTLAGNLRRETAAFTIASNPAVRLIATLRRETAAFSIDAQPTIALAGTLDRPIATFVTYVVTPVTPAPIVAQAHSVVVAQAFGAVTMQGSQPVYTISEAAVPRARQRIIVDGIDVTYFRNTITPPIDYTLLEPLLYGPATLTLPQVAACFEKVGEGALSWIRPGAPVEVQRVLDDVVVGTDFKGIVVAYDISGRNLTVELGGEAIGRAALRNRQVPIFPRINDLGRQIADALTDLGLPHYPHLGAETGIEMMTSGGTGHLDHINDLVSKAWTRAGAQWTVMPNEATGAYETHRKDVETIDGTVFIDDAKTVANLRRDIAEEPNRIYVTCVTPAGMRVRFGVYPELVQGVTPDFPGHMEEGDTGEGVRLLIGKLHATGYLKLTETEGGFDSDVVKAVEALQDDAGLNETGEVNEATWEALYDVEVTGTALGWAHIEPAAQRRKVRPWNRAASGTILGENPDYDPNHLVRDRNIDLGSGVTRSQAREFARTVLHDSDDANWVGDITFHAGALIRGDGFEGMTVDAGDVMDAREIRPGMNLDLPQFDGGTLVHVSAAQVNSEGIVTATVDTRARDAMEVWEVIARNAESRRDPSRKRNRQYRASTIVKDSIGEWDEIGGLLGVDIDLKPGWNVFETVGAMEGTISRILLTLGTPAEFACAVFGRSITADRLNNLIPEPLTQEGERVWRRRTTRAELKERWMLYSSGSQDEPCGYGADLKTDGAELTGEHDDDSSWRYASADRTTLHVAIWVEEENTLPIPAGNGRILWPQLEAGV